MKLQAFFLRKMKVKQLRYHLLQCLIGALRVNTTFQSNWRSERDSNKLVVSIYFFIPVTDK